MPLVEDDEEDAADEEDAVDEEEADDFVSEPAEPDPVDESDEAEPDAFAEADDGVLLDEEPRLSFR